MELIYLWSDLLRLILLDFSLFLALSLFLAFMSSSVISLDVQNASLDPIW